jgi:SAM-dependent methyltransferase
MAPVTTRDTAALRILNLGCGRKFREDAVNLDITTRTSPDLVHDLNQRPWPFADDRFDAVIAADVIEHLDDVAGTMSELYRVCAPGARLYINVPHFSSDGAYTDPTHRHYFGAFTFDYFTEGHPLDFYTAARFANRSTQIIFRPTLVNKVVWRVAKRFPRAWEQGWAWIFPAWFIAVELEVVKNPPRAAPPVV